MGGVGGAGSLQEVWKSLAMPFFCRRRAPRISLGPKFSREFSLWGAAVVTHLGAGPGCRHQVSGAIMQQIATQRNAVDGCVRDVS